jgi:hypothetical protein
MIIRKYIGQSRARLNPLGDWIENPFDKNLRSWDSVVSGRSGNHPGTVTPKRGFLSITYNRFMLNNTDAILRGLVFAEDNINTRYSGSLNGSGDKLWFYNPKYDFIFLIDQNISVPKGLIFRIIKKLEYILESNVFFNIDSIPLKDIESDFLQKDLEELLLKKGVL